MKVLFICKGNWYRSQMAEEIYNRLTKSQDASSAGTYCGAPDEPEGQKLKDLFISTYFFDAMEERGFDVRDKMTKSLEPEMLDRFDTVVCMAEEPFIPEYLKTNPKIIWWEIENRADSREIVELHYHKLSELIKGLIA